LWSMLASSSRGARRLLRLAGSPVLCRTMVSSWTLLANDSGDCSYIRVNTYHRPWGMAGTVDNGWSSRFHKMNERCGILFMHAV
jgi:hypothetical protein